VVISSC